MTPRKALVPVQDLLIERKIKRVCGFRSPPFEPQANFPSRGNGSMKTGRVELEIRVQEEGNRAGRGFCVRAGSEWTSPADFVA
jgi:hypothetical protein